LQLGAAIEQQFAAPLQHFTGECKVPQFCKKWPAIFRDIGTDAVLHLMVSLKNKYPTAMLFLTAEMLRGHAVV